MKRRTSMTHPLRRGIAALMALILCLSILPAQVFAEEQTQGAAEPLRALPAAIETRDGEVAVDEEEDWNETYPYGTFAFGGYQADVGEAGARTAEGEALPNSVLIPVYRLGGTRGRVTAWITCAPSITTNPDGTENVYDYAASALDDLLVEYEDANPIAEYQQLGVPRWELDMQPGGAALSIENGDETVTVSLPAGIEADDWRWQVCSDGFWKDVETEDKQGPSFALAGSALWDSDKAEWTGADLRCVWFKDGSAFCSESLLGKTYEPIPTIEEPPADVKSVEDPGYTALKPDETYGLYEFPLTFADGETVKYIRVTALDDEISELPELALFTITGCEGGKLSATSNTMTVLVSDADEDGPSELGFAARKVTASRGSSAVRAAVKREGDKSYNVTVRYETRDGTAKAGVDYAAARGTLSFAGSIDDVEIPVELIANDAKEDRSFTIVLSELQGGGTEELCELQTREITVTITDQAELPADGSGRNLATVLADPDGAQVGATVSDDALFADNSEAIQAGVVMDEPEMIEADFVLPSRTQNGGAAQPNSRMEIGKYKFSRGSSYSTDYWRDWECLINNGEYNTNTTAHTDQRFDVSYQGYLGNLVLADSFLTVKSGMRNNIYKGLLIDSNWRNEVKLEKVNSAFTVGDKVYSLGDYFSAFKCDIEWHSIGVYKTNIFYDCHRYMRPIVTYSIVSGTSTLRSAYKDFETDGGTRNRNERPNQQTIRAFTTTDKMWMTQTGSKWSNQEPENQGMGAIPIRFGEDVVLQIQQVISHTWNNEDAPSPYGLCDDVNDEHSEVDVRRLEGQRRAFSRTRYGINLVIHTANDPDEVAGPDYATLDPGNTLYSKLAPTVSMVSKQSGVNTSGDLYVGSQLQIQIPNVSGYTMPDNGLWLENSKGAKVGYLARQNGSTYNLTMLWNGIGESDLNETYTLHVFYNHTQRITFDVAPSVPRKDKSSEMDTNRIEETWNSFISGRPDGAHMKYYTDNSGKPVFSKAAAEYKLYSGAENAPAPGITGIDVDACFTGNGSGEYTANANFQLQNMQSINFHKDKADAISFNGRLYAGDETIYLTQEDLTLTNLRFTYYTANAKGTISPMKVSVDQVEVYFDRDGDGVISGEFTGGGFAVDEDRDEYVGTFSGDYPESTFKPVRKEERDKDGNLLSSSIHRYYLKVLYTARPRSLQIPAGGKATDRAQILPAFFDAVTNDAEDTYKAPEEKSCRWIAGTDNHGNVSNNADGKLMYGAEATKLSYVDIPLGGDVNSVEMEIEETLIREPDEYEDVLDQNGKPMKDENGNVIQKLVHEGSIIDCYTETTYTWHPDFVGTLLVPFANPSPVYNDKNATDTSICMADENVIETPQGYSYSPEGLRKMNGYLGSFVGRSGFALGIQQQTAASNEIQSLDQVKPETLTMGTVFTTPSDDSISAMDMGGDSGKAEGEAPGEEIERDEFAPDIGTELPSLEFELGDYATIVMDGYEVGFTIGIPVFSKSNEYNYSTDSSGAQKSVTTSDDGMVTNTHTVSGNGKTVTDTVSTVDPTDHNKRTSIVTKVTEDQNGRKRTEWHKIEETKDANGEWKMNKRTKLDNAPETPSNNNSESAAENFTETSGINTLKDFCNAIDGKRWDELKKLSQGKALGDEFTQAKSGQNKCRKVELSFNVQLAIMFEYNPIDNCHYFKQAGVSATLGVEFTVQARLAACPVFYIYLKMGVEIEAGFSLSCTRQAVEGDLITNFIRGSRTAMREGTDDTMIFSLDMRKDYLNARGFHMDLDGSVYMEVYDPAKPNDPPLISGFFTGEGDQKEILFQEYDKIVNVKLMARGTGGPDIRNIKPVLRADSLVVFDGITITPSLSIEVGAGVGIELVKAEIFLKTSVAITMTTAGYLEETGNVEGFYISNFEWNIALGLHLTFLFVNFDMDVIAFGVEGSQQETGGYFTWDIAASSFNGMLPIWSKTTYTTSTGKGIDGEPPEPDGINLYRGFEGITFYNPDGKQTNTADNAGNDQGWYFLDHVSAWYWWGGDFEGQRPLNQNLAVARKTGSYVTFTTSLEKIDIYFDGEIKVTTAKDTESFSKSPATVTLGGAAGQSVKITATKAETKLDHFCEAKEKPKNQGNNYTPGKGLLQQMSTDEESLVRVSTSTDVSDTQTVTSPFENSVRPAGAPGAAEPNAITPTAASDFQLSGYNTSGDAKKLVGELAAGYSYKVAQAGGNTWLVYPLMISGKPQLVVSRLIMTGDLTGAGTGLVHPFAPTDPEQYILLDDDGFTDLDYAVRGDGNSLTVSWVSYADAEGTRWSVKRRTLDLTANQPGSTEQLDAGAGFRYAPSVNDGTALWAEASGSAESANAKLKAWLLAKNEGLTEAMLDNVSVSDSRYANAVFFWATQSRMNAAYGTDAVLHSSTGKTAQVTGQIENLETAKIGGKTYILYTTAAPEYFDARLDTPVTAAPENFDENTERGTVYRLYLRTLDRSGFGEPKLLQTVVDFESCNEDNLSSAKLKDGIYIAGARASAKADPYFANLRFVTADIDGSGEQTLALFEMGGNSYVITQGDLKGIASSSSAEITLRPIFTETTGTEVTIGSDGKNLAAVYTAPMANSPSNAIYAVWWDKELQAWGAPTILAMRNLQVYEDSIAYDLDPDELKQAYLGKATGNEAYDAYLAALSDEGRAQAAGSMSQLTFSNLQTAAHLRRSDNGAETEQLIVLTEGALVGLKSFSFDMGDGKSFDTVVPESESKVGFYAIAFGAGEQALGEASFGLSYYDFSIGSKLVGEVSFTNTGTTAIRASEANPCTIRLMAGAQEIATWHLTESIPSGRTTRLTFTGLPLASSLPTGTTFSLSVQEDDSYFGEGAFSEEIPALFTVEEKPELSFGSFDAVFDSVSGDTARLNFNATVLNNGSGDAGEVFLQFSYGTGEKDDNGEEIYYPVDITGSSFTTSRQEAIPRQAVTENYKQGVYRLKDDEGKTNLDKNYYRTVSGVLCVPTSCFASLEEYSGLHLRVEIFSDADDPDMHYGVYTSDHNEYNPSNNRAETTIKHRTVFSMPDRIVTALGTTMMLPVSFESTSANPDIVLTEITDGTEDWSPRMGVCYYDPDRKVIVAAPNSTAKELLDAGQSPTGIIQVKDQATNTICAIVYRVGAMADGVNIYRDDASFRFFDPDGTPTDVYASAMENPSWGFIDWATADVWTGGEVGEIPMNNDLVTANQDGAYFTFDTVATRLDFYFAGKLTVECGGATMNVTQSPAALNINNPSGETRTVTVRAQKGTVIDRYVGHYASNTVADTDPDAPQILWNRSFPDTASLLPGSSVPMTCYILDGSSLKSVRFNGQTLTGSTNPALVKVDENLWYFAYEFQTNETCSVQAFDATGNSSVGKVSVNWFNDVPSASAVRDAPDLRREHLSFVDEAGNPVNTAQTLTAAPYLKSACETQANETVDAYLFQSGAFSAGALAKSTGGRWLANWNGYYQVRVERSDGSWARAIVPLTTLELTPPADTLQLSGSGTPADPYRIGSTGDWLELGRYINAGNSTSGLCFLQTANLTLGRYDMIAPDSSRCFRGSYDGGGHTLTFTAEDAPENCAPFLYVRDASFRNLHIVGSIATSRKFAAGLAANVQGGCTVVNCRSSVEIRSGINGDGTHGGFFAVVCKDSELTMTGCTFDGAVYGANTTHSGGFVGCNKSTIRFIDCFCAPQVFEWSDQCYAFSRDNDGASDPGTASYVNSYYTLAPNDAQGLRARAILPSENVSLDFGDGTVYNVAGLTACAPGMALDGVLYAGTGEEVFLRLSTALPDTNSVFLDFSATAGTLRSVEGGYRFVPAEADATVNVTTTLRLEGSGTEADPHRIGTSEEWTLFTEYVNAGYPTEDLCFRQTADIEASNSAGTQNAPFRGVYDGGGKTLTLSIGTNEGCAAPFGWISGVTIKNLVTDGKVSGGHHSSGLVGGVQGTDENRIENCAVLAEITANTDYIGGFVGHGGSQARTAIIGCLFDGKLVGANHAATFWGWGDKGSTPVLTDCLDRSACESPIGLSQTSPAGNVTDVWYAAAAKIDGPDRPWNKTEQGVRGFTVTPGRNVALDFGMADTRYDVSDISVYASGISCGGVFYTGANASVSMKPGYVGDDPDNAEDFFLASSGQFTKKANGSYELKLAGENVVVDIGTHEWNKPSYIWSADCRTVVAKRTCKHNSAHVQTETLVTDGVEVEAPTCVEPGDTTYTAEFWNSVFETQTRTVSDIEALGHNFDGWTVTTAPTCTGQGVETGTCTRCGATDTRAAAALGHDFAFSAWSWSDDNTAAQAKFTCKRDASHTEDVDAVVTREYIGASCDAPGTVVYTAEAAFGGKTWTDKKTVDLAVLGHEWGKPTYLWSEDFSTVTARAVCQKDPSHAVEETVKTNFILTRPSTFEQKGDGYFLAEFASDTFTAQSMQIAVPEVACVGGEACPGRHFTDMPAITSYAHIPIDWAVLNRITTGMSATTFKPNGNCTRAQFVTFLWRSMGQPEPSTTETSFTDVKPDGFYYKAVLWAVEKGVTTGVSATAFKPNALVTRGQVVTFLWRAEGQPEPKSDQNVFTDVAGSAFYYKAMLWAVENEITKGMTATTFAPGGSCIRAQVVTFLYREFGK